MTKGLRFGRSLRGTPVDSRMFAGLRRPRLRPARLERAEERRNDNRSKPLFRTLRRIHPSDCFTTPAAGNRHREDGSLDGRRHARRMVVVLTLVRRPSSCKPPGRRLGPCVPGRHQWHARFRFFRALRPSICRLPFRNRVPAVGRLRRSDGRSRQQPTKEGEKRLYGRRRFRKSSFWKS